ncbi:hypothetical protein WJU23_16955 [Prosthecobacter sp. SYSU 5D2]|uniref:putative polyvalent protein kinase domain-containing protein n=1 Tax=Prosthecobacter sp. SYSU 5D2 TaxID=3134134 RepID=UPI0031FEDDF8
MSEHTSQIEAVEAEVHLISRTPFSLETTPEIDFLIPELEPLYAAGKDRIYAAHASFGGPKGLLRSAAASLLGSPQTNHAGDSGDPREQEIRAIGEFARNTGLILDAKGVTGLIEKNFLDSGMEHRVGVLIDRGLVLKSYDPRDFNPHTGDIFYKPTDSLFDYLTDHLLSNFVFGDDVHLEGFYEEEETWFIVISQPFIDGRHIQKDALVKVLEDKGLRDSGSNQFKVDGGEAGDLTVTDIHEGNVLFDTDEAAYVIDAHFKFESREARLMALMALGLWEG